MKERQVKILSLLTPRDYEFTHNEHGFFFQKKGKSVMWCVEFNDALDFMKLIRGDRKRHWWESDKYLNEYI